jgi:hypothetical protein
VKGIAYLILIATIFSAPSYAADKTSAAAPGAWAQEPASFMGIKFSSNIIDDLIACPVGYETPKGMCYDPPYSGFFRLNGLPNIGLGDSYELLAKVFDNEIQYFRLNTGSENFARLEQIFIAKYGRPTSQSAEPLETTSGVELSNEKLSWSGPNVLIFMTKYSKSISTSSVTISNRAITAEAWDEQQKKIQEGASKL